MYKGKGSTHLKMYIGLQEIAATVQQDTQEPIQTQSLYWDRMEIAYKIFRVMGYIPYKQPNTDLTVEPCYKAWLWVVFATTVHLGIVVTSNYMRTGEEYWDSYDKTLESLTRLLFTNNIIFILATWRESSKINKYINSWVVLTQKLDNTLLTPVTCFSRRKFRLSLLCTALCTLSGVLADQFTLQGGFHLFFLFSYFISDFVSAHFTLFWAANCLFIVQVTRCFKHNLFKALQTKTNPSNIEKYRLLWLELRNTAVYLPEAFKGSIGLQICINIISLIFSIYSLMTSTVYTKDTVRIVGFFVPIVWNAVTLMIICEFSYLVSQEVGRKLIYKLLLHNLSTHNYELLQSDEMISLLDTFETNSPDFVIHGCFTVNRSLLITTISSIVTYIMVLLQFDARGK